MIKIYGIKNCNSVKKALDWLSDNNLSYQFCDYKKEGANLEILEKCIENFGLEKVLNKRGTTWRKLSEEEQNKVSNKEFAINLMLQNTSVIKRPIIDSGLKQLIGFDANEYKDALL